MSTKRKTYFKVAGQKLVTPKGKALWCKVVEPERTYNDKGTYSTNLVLDPKDPKTKELVDTLTAMRDEAYDQILESDLKPADKKKLNKKDIFDEEYDADDNETGNIIIKMKLDNVDDKTANDWVDKVYVKDAAGNMMDVVPLIGNGSTIRCVVWAKAYHMASTNQVGITLGWNKMQLIDLVKYEAKGGDKDFDEEEGFRAEDAVAPPKKAAKPKNDEDFDDEEEDEEDF